MTTENKIRFTPYAWAKLVYLRDKGNTEVGGYGISSIEDPLLVKDFFLVKQTASAASFHFDDEGLVTFVEDMIDKGLEPAEFQRILIHTHPGASPSPSHVDEEIFRSKLSDCSWSVMFILAKQGQTHCSLKYKTPNCRFEIKTELDCNADFSASDHESWDKEYQDCVEQEAYFPHFQSSLGEDSEYYPYRYRSNPYFPKNVKHFSSSTNEELDKRSYSSRSLPRKEVNPNFKFYGDDYYIGEDDDNISK